MRGRNFLPDIMYSSHKEVAGRNKLPEVAQKLQIALIWPSLPTPYFPHLQKLTSVSHAAGIFQNWDWGFGPKVSNDQRIAGGVGWTRSVLDKYFIFEHFGPCVIMGNLSFDAFYRILKLYLDFLN